MIEKKYQFTIKAENEEETRKIAEALNVIYLHIGNKDLKWVADHIKKDPKVIQKVIKIANNPMVKAMF